MCEGTLKLSWGTWAVDCWQFGRIPDLRRPGNTSCAAGSCEIAYSLTIPSVFVRACPCPSVLVRVRPSHALIEPAKESISQDPPCAAVRGNTPLTAPPLRGIVLVHPRGDAPGNGRTIRPCQEAPGSVFGETRRVLTGPACTGKGKP